MIVNKVKQLGSDDFLVFTIFVLNIIYFIVNLYNLILIVAVFNNQLIKFLNYLIFGSHELVRATSSPPLGWGGLRITWIGFQRT